MHAHITAFKIKLRLWEAQLANGQLEHFPRLAACVPDDMEPDTCLSVVTSLREEYASRFAGVQPLAADFKLFTAPFDFPVDDDPAPLQRELVVLQCNDELKAKFYNSSPLAFFRDIALPSRHFPKYSARVQRTVAMFGGTYCCEQLFSKMKCTKSPLRSLLSRPPYQWHSSVVELIHRAGHWQTSSWQAAPAISLICLLCNKSIVIIL